MEPHEDIPPPPYSETDIYSQPGSHGHHASVTSGTSSGSTNANAPGTGTGFGDDASSVAASSSSPGDGDHNIIYTPPETPREGSPLHRHRHYDDSTTDYITNASAEAYFEFRPAPSHLLHRGAQFDGSGNDNTITVYISIATGRGTGQATTSPSLPPYPADWAPARDVTEQDWHTFVNYLIPDRGGRGGVNDLSSSSSSFAQGVMQDTLRDWNVGFFGPRGVTVRIRDQTPTPARDGGPSSIAAAAAARDAKMPGAWDEEEAPSSSPPPPPAAAPGGNDAPREGGGPGWNPFEVNSRGVRIGPLTIDGDRVSIGQSFQVDSRGVRWGGRTIGGAGQPPVPTPFDGQHQQSRGGERGPAIGCGSMGMRGGWGSGHLPGGVGMGMGAGVGGPGFGAPWNPFDHVAQAQHTHGFHAPHPGIHRPRSASDASFASSPSSSSSTSDSSDSSSSDSSIGSLPAYEDLQDAQIPVTRQSITTWLSHPEQPVTRAMLKAARADIRAAATTTRRTSNTTTTNNTTNLHQVQQQRLEVRQLLNQFQTFKRSQRDLRRADHRCRRDERKAARLARKVDKKVRRMEHKARRTADRAGRRERRTAEREVRRAERENRDRGVGGGRRRGGAGGGVHQHLSPLGVPVGMPMPPRVPNIHVPPPHVPGPGGAFFGPRSGFFGGGGFGGRRGGGSFGFGGGRGFGGRGGRGGNGGRGSHRFPPWARGPDEYLNHGVEQHDRATTGVIFDADNIPGAWPTTATAATATADRDGHDMVPPAHLGAKYEAVERLEAEMEARKDELRAVWRRDGSSDGGDKEEQREKEKESSSEKAKLVEVDRLEVEMRRLAAEVERLRLEADEEFARGFVERGL